VFLQQQSSSQNTGLRHLYRKQDSAESVLSVTLVHIECWISPFLRGRRRHVVVTNLYIWIGDTRGRRSRMSLFVTSGAVFNSAITSTVPSLNTVPLTNMCVPSSSYTHFSRKRSRRLTQDTGAFDGALAVMRYGILSSNSTFTPQRLPTVATAIPLSSLNGTSIFSNNDFTYLLTYSMVQSPS